MLRPLCSPKSKGFKKLHTDRFAIPMEPEHSSAQGQGAWEKPQADLLGIISGSNLCERSAWPRKIYGEFVFSPHRSEETARRKLAHSY